VTEKEPLSSEPGDDQPQDGSPSDDAPGNDRGSSDDFGSSKPGRDAGSSNPGGDPGSSNPGGNPGSSDPGDTGPDGARRRENEDDDQDSDDVDLGGSQSSSGPTPEDLVSQLEEHLAEEPRNQELLLQASRYYHRTAMQGDVKALDRAQLYVERLLELDKKHVEALSIRGSLLTIEARRSGSLLKKMLYSFKAARTLDRAVKLDPSNLSARTIRAFTALVLPHFLRRLKTAVDDFEYLLEVKSEHPEKLPDEMMPKIYLNLGLANARMGDLERAREILDVVISRFPGTREATRAHSLLRKIQT
jgi:tetratricopeptide (TPR) repeat protein